MREIMTNVVMLSLAFAALFPFTMIAIYGQVTPYEPNLIILTLEIALIIAIIVFGCLNLIKLLKRHQNM